MVKSKYSWTEEKIERYIKEGRGTGELSEYKPWLTIQDVPSKGKVRRVKGWKTKRNHHLLSKLERNFFYICEWSDHIIDTREQFPLDRIETLRIANEIGVRHPFDKDTETPIVMTTDFLLTIRQNGNLTYLARTIKPSEYLEDPRVIEKFEIELRYWTERKVDWKIVTEADLSDVFFRNMEAIRDSYFLTDEEDVTLLNTYFNFLQFSTKKVPWKSLLECSEEFDREYNLDSGTAIAFTRHLIASKKLIIDIMKKIDFRRTKLEEITLCGNKVDDVYEYFIS
ncbi:TnsA endonuclease N-terminal domain-containing protein [Bacillus sp. 31A1R]|uniref:TnsA endonuclease N-terminal domain-containing protein n=1 Tax=Robertmurraya mangrovi TaxID=3098077 RepID=A0ABU5J460_9BACI|nr:TnsA endonuclease N-terminal domain-containing protein [Bacillus sp. 31A1R]MDZ5474183.1 TnsA endonuclease N-terminal domain-containing protein [Bacillus sp. 31A1R]